MFIDPDGRKAAAPDTWSWNVGSGGVVSNYLSGQTFTDPTLTDWKGDFMSKMGAVASGSILTDPKDIAAFQQSLAAPDYFAGINFSQFRVDNDEEPVSFFGKMDNKVFHEKFKEMQKKFGGTKGDGIFRVFGHGFDGGIWDGENLMKDADSFDKVMSKKNSRWKSVDKMEKSMLILYSCLSGYDDENIQSMAQKISILHLKTIVVGFEKWIPYDINVTGFPMINRLKNSDDNWGWVKVYLNGKIIQHQPYRNFIK